MIRYLAEHREIKWVDVTQPTDDELLEISEKFGLPYSYVKHCLEPEHMPEYEALFGTDVKYISLRMFDDNVASDADTVRTLTQKLVLFYGPDFIVTLHNRTHSIFNSFCLRLQESLKQPRPVNQVVDRTLMQVLHTYDEPIANARQKLDNYEEKVFIKADNTLLIKDIYYLKRRITVIKALLDATLEVSRELPDTDSHERYHEVEHYNEKLIFRNNELLEGMNSLLNLHLALNAHRTNEVMRILTVFSVLFMPLTFIVGVYGMNFENMPELKTRYGYFMVLCFMASLGCGLFIWFKKRGWLKI